MYHVGATLVVALLEGETPLMHVIVGGDKPHPYAIYWMGTSPTPTRLWEKSQK